MSKFSKRGQRRIAGAAAVAAVAAIGLSSMGAGGAAAGPLANGYKESTGLSGEKVQIWRKGEASQITQTVANNPANRAAAFGGTYTAKLSKGLNGNIALKYIIGCQVDITGLTLGLSGSLSLSSLGGGGTLTLPLAPGQVKIVDVTDKDIKSGGSASLQVQTSVYTPGCAGYASARSAVLVVAGNGYNTDDGTVNGSGTYMQSTLYGQPFSLG
ncbi:MspA family porin [Gordonia sp. CPCC 205515]|uniref:MspA family porin n=1 Tax=Gordonia sp. CPCC 205515 TaxID=3140791 RepID=UPI003AF3B821